jgi:hypothetical protein
MRLPSRDVKQKERRPEMLGVALLIIALVAIDFFLASGHVGKLR